MLTAFLSTKFVNGPEKAKGPLNRLKPRFTGAILIQASHYYGQFALSLGKESPYIFS